MGRDGDRCLQPGRRGNRPAPVPGQHRRGRGGQRRAIQPERFRRWVRAGRRFRGHWLRGDAGVREPAAGGPAGEPALREERAGREELDDPPGVVTFCVNELHRSANDLEIAGDAASIPRGRQPGSEDILKRAAPPTHRDGRLDPRQPDRAEGCGIEHKPEQAFLDHKRPHEHGRLAGLIAEHDVAVLDSGEPVPPRRRARDAAGDPGEGSLERPVPQARVDKHGGGQPAGGQEHGQSRQRKHSPSPARRPPCFRSTSSPCHDRRV